MWYIKAEQIKDNFNIKAPSVKEEKGKETRVIGIGKFCQWAW